MSSRIQPLDPKNINDFQKNDLFSSDKIDIEINMWRLLVISATLALVISSSTALSLPLYQSTSLALAPFNITSPAPEAPVEKTINLTYYLWPKQPYEISLHGPGLQLLNVVLVISVAQEFRSSPMVSVSELRHFIQDFADNIQREYPIPGFIPHHATQSIIDISSYTRWIINIDEGMFRGRLPTAAALAALNELGKQVGRYGPSRVSWLIYEDVGVRLPWASGNLIVENIEGVFLNKSSSHDNGTFHTA